MVYKEHFIELWINGSKVELEDQKSLNMRFNNVITDPTKISSNQAEYSFEFEIPATPKNNVILDYANNLGKLNKFHQRYNAEVYADGTVIFAGTITINGFKENKYQLNLVSVKVYSLDDIFGDATMNMIKQPNGDKWSIPFDGVPTINEINGQEQTEVSFPLVSYGVFQKNPYSSDEVAKDFTSKFDLDKWARFYVESFYPSHNMLATLRRAFEYKGYKVGGDAFANDFLRNIYMSTNLADGQVPLYNIGNPKFGSVNLQASLTTAPSYAYAQELDFPYYRLSAKQSNVTYDVAEEYNFKDIELYDILAHGSVSVAEPTYLYQPDEHIIVVPADGFYKIELDINSTLNTTTDFVAAQYTRYNQAEEELEEEDLTLTPSLSEITPLEIALVRNYDDNYELIKGKHNTEYVDGNPNHEIAWDRYENQVNWQTCYPHEDPYASVLPTEKNDLNFKNSSNRMGGERTSSTSSDGGRMGGQRSRTRGGTIGGGTIDRDGGGRRWSAAEYGYIYNDGEIMAYDPAVSESFICGFSSLKGGTVSVIKNGYSWSKSNSTKNEAFYPEIGYSKLYRQEGSSTIETEQTRFNENIYINTPISRITATNRTMTGYLSCMVYLHRNDVLELFAVQRGYHTAIGNPVRYSTSTQVSFKLTAASPRTYDQLKADHFEYYSPTEFDVNLNLANFLNSEKKISDWVQNIADAYNLEIIQNGKTVDFNTRKKPNLMTAVDLDDRCNYSEAEAKAIDYPKSMAIKYKIDDDEWGFERSAVKAAGGDESILNNDDWKKYADSGYTEIQLNDDSYVTSTSDKNLQFSYTWYDTFHWYSVNNTFSTQGSSPVNIQIPVISKFTYMIDGYNYEESMKHDGYGLAQRFWFKPTQTPFYVWTRTYPAEMVTLYLPSNSYSKLKLNYKDVEGSLLYTFFNVNAYLASNYVIIDVYLTADEYNRIKNGALVHFDSDLYIPVEVSGYDPSGNNATTLTLMKKVA